MCGGREVRTVWDGKTVAGWITVMWSMNWSKELRIWQISDVFGSHREVNEAWEIKSKLMKTKKCADLWIGHVRVTGRLGGFRRGPDRSVLGP